MSMSTSSLNLDLSSPELSYVLKPAIRLSRSWTPATKKLPPPPPRKPPQRSRSYWIKDNLQMSITSDIEHSDLDIDEHKDQKHPIATIHPPTICLDIPYRSNTHRRRHSDMVSVSEKSKNMIQRLSVDIKSKTSKTPRAYVKRDLTPKSVPDTPDTPDTPLPSLRSVNKHKAKITQERLRKNRMSTRKSIRRKQRADSGLMRHSSSDSDSDNTSTYSAKVIKKNVSHKKSQSAPFAIRNLKLSDLHHERHEKHKRRKQKKKKKKLKSNKDLEKKVKSPKSNKFSKFILGKNKVKSPKKNEKRPKTPRISKSHRTKKNNKMSIKSPQNNRYKDKKMSIKSPKSKKDKKMSIKSPKSRKDKKMSIKSPKSKKGSKSPRTPKSPRSPTTPLARIKDNKAKRVSKSKFATGFADDDDDDDDVYRSYKVKSIPHNMENKSFWSKPHRLSATYLNE